MITTILNITVFDNAIAYELVTSKQSALLGAGTPCCYREE